MFKMKKIALALVLLIYTLHSNAQSTAGITGLPDTSFTIAKEYVKLKKNYPQIKFVNEFHSKSVKEKKDIIYCTIGGRKLLLNVFYPSTKNREKQTAIMIIHGGGWRSGNKMQHHPLAQRLADLGYVCFTPQYRLSTEALYPAAVHDLKAALRWIRAHAKEYDIDTSKIAIAGFSAGGQLAALLGTTMDNSSFEGSACHLTSTSNLQAVIDIDGTLSFIHSESGEGDDSKKTSAATYWFGYSKNENYELWKEASPLTHVSKNTPPTLFINSSVARMHAGRDDYIKILDQYDIYTRVKTFEGSPHSFPLFEPWFDSTVKIIDEFLKKTFERKYATSPSIVVAQDGTGNYKTVQAALDAIPLNNKNPATIFIKKGIYNEKLLLNSTKNFVTLIGEDKFNTILTYNDHTGKLSPSGDTINTRTSWSFKIEANDFTAENITFENDAGFTAGQAVAVESDGDKAVFKNCRFLGNQDVLFTNNDNSRQYFENCYIEGTTDFIFGSSTVWFQQCHIHSKKNSHITAASTPKGKSFGYIFNDCILTGDTALHNVSLGRPWRPYAHVMYMNCFIGEHIKAEGWANWNNTENYLTARYEEFKNYGTSANPGIRVKWAKQLTDEEVKKYTLKNVFGDWQPDKIQ
jgi:pectin methylesterase-like acyl-CoA thioesterase/dienelactone hydrolase